MNNSVLITALLATLYVTGFAAPLSENEVGRTEKRSDELIFFEEGSQGSMLAKRSQKTNEWPNKLAQSIKEKESKPANVNEVKVDKELIEEIEEEAFYDALSFLVEKIIDEGYEYEADESSEDIKTTKRALEDATDEMEEYTTPSITEAHDETEGKSVDSEATQLENLFLSPKKSQSMAQAYDYLGEERKPETDGKEVEMLGLMSDPIEESSENLKPDSEPRNKDEDLYAEYEEVVQYMEYLNTLKDLENKLKSQLGQYQPQEPEDADAGYGGHGYGNHDDEEYKEETDHSIRKRSIPDGVGEARELELFGGMKDVTEEREQSDGGVFFTAKEAEELKQLLVELAKERMESQDVIKYLLDNPDEVYAVDAPEPQPLLLDDEPSFYKQERPLSLFETEPKPQNKRFKSAYDSAPLDRLASRLSSRYGSGYEAQKRRFWI